MEVARLVCRITYVEQYLFELRSSSSHELFM
jgi:hypothetical protein